MNNRWILTGNYGGATPAWNTIVSSPSDWPHPQNEVDSPITSTSKKYSLVDGSEARVSKTNKYLKPDVTLSYSVFATAENRTYEYPATPVTYTIREIIEQLILNNISIRIQYQEYEGAAWVTKETFAGYFKSVGKQYRMLAYPQLYVVDVSLERFPVDGSTNY